MRKRRAVVDDLVEQYGDYCSTFTFKMRSGLEGQIHKEGFINCFWNKTSKLVYMHIDKCGSTSVSSALKLHCPNFLSLDLLKTDKDPDYLAKYFVESDHTFFAVTRDPVQRWISGLNEFMCRYKPPIDWVIGQIEKGKFIFDEHTGPQTTFLRLCLENQGKVKLIKLEGDLSVKVNLFMKNNTEDYKPFHVPHLRDSKYFTPNYKPICAKIYTEYVEQDNERFLELYESDYELYAKGI
jgi:hypothetical protein